MFTRICLSLATLVCLTAANSYAQNSPQTCQVPEVVRTAIETIRRTYLHPEQLAGVQNVDPSDYCRGIYKNNPTAAIEAVYGRAQDRFTHYYTKDEWRLMWQTPPGVGLRVALTPPMSDGVADYVVLWVVPNSPAANAGVVVGDHIAVVNNIPPVSNLPEGVLLIPGHPNVILGIRRKGTIQEFIVPAEPINMPEIFTKDYSGDIRLIRLAGLMQDATVGEMEQALRNAPSTVVLDLRRTPGGKVDVAHSVAGALIDRGVIDTEEIRQRGTGEMLKSTYTLTNEHLVEQQGNTFSEGPREPYLLKTGQIMVVLVDEDTASAAELLTGALQAHEYVNGKRVIWVIGASHTFGKGIIQTLFPMSDGSEARITNGYYKTPEGIFPGDPNEPVHPGLKPDIVVATPSVYPPYTDGDPIWQAALEIIRANQPGRLGQPNLIASTNPH